MVSTPSLTLAFAAGFVSFVSPCCLPLVPGYLATVGGGATSRRVLMRRSLTFVSSFSLMFILLGLSATALGSLLITNQQTLNTIAGVVIIAMGLAFVGSIFILQLNRTWRVPGVYERAAAGGPALAGLAFALAWTPCVGPTLGAILGLAATTGTTPQAAGLLAVYSAGLAVPFLLSAFAFERVQGGVAFFRRHYQAVQVVAGISLIAMGLLVLSGELFRLNIEAQQTLNGLGLNFYKSI